VSEKASEDGDSVLGPCWTNALPAEGSPRFVKKDGLRWPRFVRRGFSFGCISFRRVDANVSC
jgi:hypothetical protein